MNREMKIENRLVSEDSSCYIIAEMSGNHGGDLNKAKAIVKAAKEIGADAIKLQTYTPDTLTIDCDKPCFQTQSTSLWKGTTLYELYKKAYTPWEWQPELKKYADELGIACFSSPFDGTAVDLMSSMNMPAYKVASYEITDIPLIRKIARQGKPVIISTGIAYLSDIERALQTCKDEGNENVILLKCTSAYPAPYEDMNLREIQMLKDTFGCMVGISDHSLGSEVALGAVALGAKVVEKHMKLEGDIDGVDAKFSLDVPTFATMIEQIRNLERALGDKTYALSEKQVQARRSSRSLFVTQDIEAGERITAENIRSIRPGSGMPPMYYDELLGKAVTRKLERGTPLDKSMIVW